MKKKRFDFAYHLSEGFRSIFTHGFMSFASVCMIVACLIIMGSFALVAINLDHNLTQLEQDNEFLAYVDENLTEEQARAIQADIEALPNVASATFVTREEALEAFVGQQGENELYQNLPETVLEHRYQIKVVDIERVEETVDRVRTVNGISDMSADMAVDVAKGFVTVRNMATAIAYILIAILFTVSLFIISNTIRLATFYRREEIAIMKMCGATDWFIRWPFIFQGLLLGLMGALLAFFLQWGVYSLIIRAVVETNGQQLMDILPFKRVAFDVLKIFSGAGLAIGVGGSLLAIRKFLQV